MIFNIDGSIKTDNIRDILQFEADFNFANKPYFGIGLMKIVESLGVLAQEKNGFRPGHTAIELEVLRSLFFEYFIQKRRNSALVQYDAEIDMAV